MFFLLDTAVLIDYMRDAPSADRIKELRSAQDLIRGLIIVPLGADEGWLAGSWRGRFAEQGTTLAQADCLIAAAAASSEATLVTGNPRDFPMPEIRVEHWPVGQ